AVTALGEAHALARLRQIVEQGLAIVVQDLGSHRHFEDQRLACGPTAVLAHAMIATPGAEMLLITIIDQRVEIGDRLHDDVAAAPAIAPVGPAEFDEFLAQERDRAGAAGAAADIDLGLIEEFHRLSFALSAQRGEGRGPSRARWEG